MRVDKAQSSNLVSLSLLQLEHWRGERQLFSDLSLKSTRPVIHLTGANGSGKTSLLKLLCYLSEPEHGEIIWQVDGQPLSRRAAMASIAFTGHKDALNPRLSVAENLRWAVALHNARPTVTPQDLLKAHELGHLADQSAGSLSAGQRRRVALLRAVVSDCPIWIWDEPYANIDSAGRNWVDALILQHAKSGGIMVLSTHQAPGIDTNLMQPLELSI